MERFLSKFLGVRSGVVVFILLILAVFLDQHSPLMMIFGSVGALSVLISLPFEQKTDLKAIFSKSSDIKINLYVQIAVSQCMALLPFSHRSVYGLSIGLALFLFSIAAIITNQRTNKAEIKPFWGK